MENWEYFQYSNYCMRFHVWGGKKPILAHLTRRYRNLMPFFIPTHSFLFFLIFFSFSMQAVPSSQHSAPQHSDTKFISPGENWCEGILPIFPMIHLHLFNMPSCPCPLEFRTNFKLSWCGNLGCKVSKTKTNSTKIYTMLPLFQFRIIQDTANSLFRNLLPRRKVEIKTL